MKRGLATVAVSALAVTGLPFLMSSASADSLADQVGGANSVILLAPETGASVKNDGVNTTVHLLASAGANAAKVRFEYQGALDLSATTIATVTRANGAFSTEWTVPVALLNDLGTSVRAVALTAADIVLDTDTEVVQVGTADESVDVANAAGSGLGVFEQPYASDGQTSSLAAVTGTTSDVAGNPDLTLDSPSGAGTDLSEDWVEDVTGGATTRDFSGPVDLSGYNWDAAAPIVDEAAVRVTAGTDSDDAEVVNLYKQTITTVTAAAEPASVQGAATTTAKVAVLDGQGKPVVGAQVIQDGGPTEYTDSRGIAEFPGLSGSLVGTAYDFVVNTTDTPAYESQIDYKRTVTVMSYTPEATTLTAASADGAAFDDDEFAAGDIEITVKDQNGNPLAGEEVTYFWHVAPFETTVGYPKDLAATVAGDNADGTYDVAFPVGEPSGTYTLNYYINTDGTPGEGPTDLAGTDLVVKAGQAELVWEDGATAQAPAGTTATFEGSLELEDGTALADRTVTLGWNPTADAVVAAQGAQPAGTTRTSNTAATADTASDGTFGIAIVDPAATPNVDELNGDLDADTSITPAAPTLDVDFLKNPDPSVPADITISDAELIDGLTTPGRPVDLDINVENSDNVDLTDYPVTVEVDHGFLSPNAETAADLVADPAAAQDGLYGEWKSDGTEKELTTDDSGNTGAVVAIEDDAAFATSDTVTTTVTVTAGTVSKTFEVDFTSENPLNGGEVRVELAAAADQTLAVLPKAPTTETVKYDLFVEDQFGNLVDGESVDLTDNLAGAEINGVDGATSAPSQLENELPALTLSSDVAGDQVVSAEWVVDSNTWTDGDLVTAGFQPSRDSDNEDTTLEDDAAAVNWYAIDYATSFYGMTHTGGATLPVGSTTTVTYKAVDQNGEPIEGLQVNFFRAGPDDEQDGAGDAAVDTDANGVAQYVFQGIKKGTAIIEAVVREPAPSTTIIPAAGVNHVVKFGTSKKAINAKIVRAASNGNKDVLTVKASKLARGAKVLMYAKIGNDIVKVGQGRLNNDGRVVIKVRDRNGNKVTQYAAIVRSTSRTLQDATPPKAVR